MKKRHAFTLIEMLVVITIIGIIAAMVVNLNAGAQKAKRTAAVKAQLTSLTLMINNYQLKLGYYPPDNAALAGMIVGSNVTFSNYDACAATNPLLYELTGATNYAAVQQIQFFDGTTNQSPSFNAMYGRAFVANANADEPHDFYNPGPRITDYAQYVTNYPGICGLVVPVPLNPTNLSFVNYWHYDASSPNRHNPSSYDLWAEYTVGSKNGAPINMTNGNW